MPISTTTGSFMPKTAEQLSREEEEEHSDERGARDADARGDMHRLRPRGPGCPAPRFCPATAAAAPMSPTDVQVMSEKNCVVRHRERRLRRGALRQRADEREHEHAADVHRDPLDAGRQAEPEERPDDRPVRAEACVAAETTRPSRPARASRARRPPRRPDAITFPSRRRPCRRRGSDRAHGSE